jgi:hypothetical protein
MIFRLIPAIALCTALAACGDSNNTTTTTTDTTTLSEAPIEAPASDNTGAGIEGAGTPGQTPGMTGSTENMNSNNPDSARNATASPDRTNGRNNPGTRVTARDSINNRISR